MQPLGWCLRSEEEIVVELRCPECFTWMQGCYTAQDMRELDRITSERRAQLVSAYERSVAESMEALARCFGRALALDLLGPDDFAPRVMPAARWAGA